MRLAKLSLAAIVAAGAMTTFASAAPLEEAIKGVDLTGMVRYRVDINDDGNSPNGADELHRFSGVFTFTAPITDSVKSILTLSYDNRDIADKSAATSANDFGVSQAYFQYAMADYSLKVGKMQLATPWTEDAFDGNRGNGVIGFYNGVDGWTFAGAAYFNTNADLDITGFSSTKQNLYAAAAIGSVGPVDIQVWASKLTHVIDSAFFGELSTGYAGFSLKGQVSHTKLADEVKPGGAFDIGANKDKGTFWAVEGGYAYEGASLKAGYIRTDKDMGLYTLSADGQFILAGQQLYSETANEADMKTYFVSGGYAFGDFSFGAGYSKAKQASKTFGNEFYVEAGYDYSKNFSLYSYYSDMDIKDNIANGDDNKQIRFQATYKF